MRASALLLLSLSAVGCNVAPPGELVGTYRITMSLEDNSCGDTAVIVTDGAEFSVQIRADERRGYWRLADQRALPGEYADGMFRFTFSSVVASTPSDGGVPSCQLVQDEVISGTLVLDPASGDAGVGDPKSEPSSDGADMTQEEVDQTTFMAVQTLSIGAASGTDCTSALSTAGGPFDKLPCTVTYTLRGRDREDF